MYQRCDQLHRFIIRHSSLSKATFNPKILLQQFDMMVSNKVYRLLIEHDSEEIEKKYNERFRELVIEKYVQDQENFRTAKLEYPLNFVGLENYYESHFEPIFQTIMDEEFFVKPYQINH